MMEGRKDLVDRQSQPKQSSMDDWEINSVETFYLCVRTQPSELIEELFEVWKKIQILLSTECFEFETVDESTSNIKWISLFELIGETSSCICKGPCIKNLYLVLELLEANIIEWQRFNYRYLTHKTDEELKRTVHQQLRDWDQKPWAFLSLHKQKLARNELCSGSSVNEKEVPINYLKLRLPLVHHSNTYIKITSFAEEYDVLPSPSKIFRIDARLDRQNIENVIPFSEQEMQTADTDSFEDEDVQSDMSEVPEFVLQSYAPVGPVVTEEVSYVVGGPSNIETGPSSSVQRPSSVNDAPARSSGIKSRLSNVEPGCSNVVPMQEKRKRSSSMSSNCSDFSMSIESDQPESEEYSTSTGNRQPITSKTFKFNFFWRLIDIKLKLFNYMLLKR